MLSTYLKTSWRNLFRNKAHSLINITGLALGMAASLLIGLWIYDELTFNKYHKNYNRMGRIINNFTFDGKIVTEWSQPFPLGEELRTKFADFENVSMASWNYGHIIEYNDKKFNKEALYVQPQFIDMLSPKMVYGNKDALRDINSLLISQTLSKILFNNDDPTGKIVKISNRIPMKVGGVYEDFPFSSDFSNILFFMPWDLYVAENSWVKNSNTNWGNFSFQTYVQLKKGADFEKVSAKIQHVIIDKDKKNLSKPAPFIHPMSKWHLYSDFENGINTGGRIRFIWLFATVGIFILLLACINFMNLSTARSEKRAKEVGIRKTIGSGRGQLISQFLFESFFLVLFSFAICIALIQLSIPWFNEITDKKLNIPWYNTFFWLFSALFIVITSLLAGSYPAFFLSSFKPLKVLKGGFRFGKNASVPRKVLVTTQFAVSIILIIGTFVVFQQIEHVRKRPIGYSPNGLITTWVGGLSKQKAETFKQELMQSGAIESLGYSTSPTTAIWSNQSDFSWEGKPDDLVPNFGVTVCSHEYGKTIGYQIVEGRDFSREFATDTSAIILNEATAAAIGLKEPIGKTMYFNFKPYTIIGIVKNMLAESPYEPIRPGIYLLARGPVDLYTLRLNRNLSAGESISRIEPIYKKFTSGNPFEYSFVDEVFETKFREETRIGKLASVFTFLAILISCLGLFGLASFVAEQRTKEIGIRKVLGASVTNLWMMLSKEFIMLVIISCFIAIPVAGYLMNNWLQEFVYRTSLHWWVFAIAGLSALLIALLTVSFQAIKAAIANPVKSLRTE